MHRTQVGGLAEAEVRPHVAPRALARDGHVSEALAAVEPLLPPERLAGLTEEDAALLLATALECRLARGDVGEALALGERLAAYLVRPGRTGAAAHYAAGELCAALNEVDTAAHHYAAAGALLTPGAADAELVPWRVGAALSAVRLGRRAEAAALAREQHERAAGSPAGAALALRTRAATEAGGDREALLRRAVETLAPLRYGRLAAQVEADLAGLLLLAGDADAGRAEALGLLRRAEAYAGRHQLWPLQTRVRGLLERAGEPARPGPQEVLATLTATERRISTLAAEGLTNRAIAARLDVSTKNVEWHLSHVYRKLGIRSRAGLAPTFAAV